MSRRSPQSEETKRKISETLKSKYESGELVSHRKNNPYRHTEESKQKISEVLKRKYESGELVARRDVLVRPRHPLTKQYILDRIEVNEVGCWIWQKSCFQDTGYGQLGRSPWSAHVLAYTLWRQKPWLVVRHLCHTVNCCNPFHLAEGTALDNFNDSRSRHLESMSALRGQTPGNSRPVRFRGRDYPSIEAARIACGVSWEQVRDEGVFEVDKSWVLGSIPRRDTRDVQAWY